MTWPARLPVRRAGLLRARMAPVWGCPVSLVGRVLPVADAFADGRLSSCLRPLARRTAGMRGTAAGGDMIGRERWQAGPGQERTNVAVG